MAERVRVAVVGTGFGASTQVPGFRKLDGVEVVAVVSGHLDKAKATAAKRGIDGAFDDFEAMLKEADPDLVSIASPPYLHYEMVMWALDRKKHVLCEKPFALSVRQAQEMVDAAERAGVVHAMDHEFRYLPARAGLKQHLAQGYVGDVRAAQMIYRGIRRAGAVPGAFDWWSEREKGGGVLGAIGTHYIDAVSWWVARPVGVFATLDALRPERPLADGSGMRRVTSDDTSTLVLRLENGAQASINLSSEGGASGGRVEVQGSEGTLVVEDDRRLLGGHGRGPLEPLPMPEPRFPPKDGEAPLIGAFAEFAHRVVEAVRGRPDADFPTFRDGLLVQAVVDGAHQSWDEKRWVEVG